MPFVHFCGLKRNAGFDHALIDFEHFRELIGLIAARYVYFLRRHRRQQGEPGNVFPDIARQR